MRLQSITVALRGMALNSSISSETVILADFLLAHVRASGLPSLKTMTVNIENRRDRHDGESMVCAISTLVAGSN
jgi:hypothetical protein